MATATSILKDASKEARANAGDLEARVEQLTIQLSELAKSVSGYGGNTLDTLTQEARRMKDDVADRSVAIASAAKDTVIAAEGDLEQRIREHPLTAIGIAAGLGFLAAILTKR
ncbi:Membrane-anchored ribosome-binding protein, inhibits growth in stationary phase, ElaB/YqjD/DUF883 family [Ensifer adhaerens]|nr:Membrane-anchored ribosome-binding protein, inhibits growth in stationary phase, ElaB/YqjD/DUF883 family [Ensifer adhaerens]HZG29631.1 DUF883 family protein [Ensifer sp.]